MPGLDVLRGVAISAVLVYHGFAGHAEYFLKIGTPSALALLALFRAGAKGVHLFFVLSGFLITSILLDSKEKSDYYRSFYWRRILRIVPAYMLMLAVLLAAHRISWRYLAVALLYLCNMSGLLGASPEYGPLWSLSVEEQFYLFWPLIVRRFSRLSMIRVTLALIVATPILRFALLLVAPRALQDIYTKVWDVADFFAAGAAVALFRRSATPARRHQFAWACGALFLGFLFLQVTLVSIPTPQGTSLTSLLAALELEPWLLLSTALLLLALLRPSMASLPWARPLVFLANISYGLYLCHQFVFLLVDEHWPLTASQRTSSLFPLFFRFGVESALAIAMATISRRTVEEFFLRLKPKHGSAAPASA